MSGIPISVWYYNELLNSWTSKLTSDYQETKDENKYFSVMSNGRKYFYASAQDYIKHNENTIVFNYDTDDNNNTIKYITDVNNTIIS
jgi:hypothetical protein